MGTLEQDRVGARTLDDLVAVAEKHGMAESYGWAKRVMEARSSRKPRAPAADPGPVDWNQGERGITHIQSRCKRYVISFAVARGGRVYQAVRMKRGESPSVVIGEREVHDGRNGSAVVDLKEICAKDSLTNP